MSLVQWGGGSAGKILVGEFCLSYFYIAPRPQIFTLYQKHFTIFTCARLSVFHFFCEEPPPPRLTPWGAYRWTWQLYPTFLLQHNKPWGKHKMFLHSPYCTSYNAYNQVEVWWLGMFRQSTHVLLYALIT